MDVPSDILQKLERYCAFQERCEHDVRKKMSTMNCSVAQRNEIIRQLQEMGFLKEERYVEIFVRSKIRDHWGKIKIRQALFAKNIDAALVDHYLNNVNNDEYEMMLVEVVEKWQRLHPEEKDHKTKLFRYLLSRGFATEEITNIMNKCIK